MLANRSKLDSFYDPTNAGYVNPDVGSLGAFV